jgi:anti-anti-sigma factor
MHMTTTHWLEREDFGSITVVRLKTPKTLDDETIRSVFDPIYALVTEVGRSQLIVNLAAVEYLPSLALGKLVMLNRKTQAANGRLVLCELTLAVEHVLETTHLDELFNMYITEQDALLSWPTQS